MPLNLAKRWECCGIGGADPLVRAGRPRPAFGTTVSVPGVAQEADGGVVPRGDPLVLGSAPLACTLFHIAVGLGEFRILDCHVVFGFLYLNREIGRASR